MSLLRAISTLGCPDLSLDDVGTLVKDYALDGAELRCLSGRTDLPTLFAEVFGSPEVFAGHVRAAGIPVVSLSTSFVLIGHSSRDREELLSFVPWAEALGISRLRVFDGGSAGSDEEFAGIASALAWWQAQRTTHRWNVDLMVETHDILTSAPRIKRFYAESPTTDLLWDTHHTWRHGGEDPVITWDAIRSRVCHLHVKDSVAVPDGKRPYTYVLPGEGEFPMAPLLARLQADNYRGFVSLEWERRWIPTLAPLSTALDHARLSGWW